MLEKISSYLTDEIICRGIINSDKKEICKIGIELILADVTNFSLILVIGFFTDSVLYACMYILLLLTVRRFSGGFHAKTYGVCRMVTIGMYILILCFGKILNVHLVLCSVILNSATVATMLIFAPVRHPNKELTSVEIQANKLFSLLSTLLYSIASIILVALGRKEGLIISLILFAIAILMYVGLFTNGKEVKKQWQELVTRF